MQNNSAVRHTGRKPAGPSCERFVGGRQTSVYLCNVGTTQRHANKQSAAGKRSSSDASRDPPPREPLCRATCCRCRMCRHSLRQFMVAMDVALSISRSWSSGERPGATGRPSMLWIRSLCWPWAWLIIWGGGVEKVVVLFGFKKKKQWCGCYVVWDCVFA